MGTLDVGQSGVITIYGQINPGLSDPVVFANSASVSAAQDNTLGNNTSVRRSEDIRSTSPS